MKHIRLLFILWMLCITTVISAQYETGYKNIVVGENHGVKSILQDSTGMIWIGAGNELFSFDGYQCTPHHISIVDDYPFTIYSMVLHDGQIYIGSDHGLYIYDCHSGTCTHPDILSKKDIRCILAEGDSLYLGCLEGVFIYHIAEQSVRQICPELRTVYTLLITPKGLLVGALSGLYMIRDEGYTAYPLQLFVNSMLHDEGTRYWIGAEDYLFSLDIADDHLEAIAELEGNSIKNIAKGRQGCLLMGTDNGLCVRDGHQILHFRHDAGNPLSMKNNSLWSVFMDRQGNLWLGHDAGLSLLCLSQQFTHYSLQHFMESDEGNYLRRLYMDRRRQLWAGGSNGLLRYSLRPGSTDKTWYRQGSPLHSLTHNFIRCIYEDGDGDIWVATDGGINLYCHKADQMRNFLLYNQEMNYNAKWAYDIFLDAQGRLWVASYEGVFVVDKKRLLASKGECIADFHYMACDGGLSGLHASQLLYTQSGEVWVISNGGIDRIDPQSHRVTHVTDLMAYCMLEDHLHRIWVGYDGGLCYYMPTRPHPVVFDFSPSDAYTRIISLQEVEGRIWAFSSSDCRVIDSLRHVSIFRLPSSHIATTCYDAPSGSFAMGGIDELITFRPDIMAQLSAPPLFNLSGLQVNNVDVNLSCLQASRQDELRLESHENNLTLHFTDMPYQGGISLVYAYRLKGKNTTWLQLDPQSLTVHLIGLPHGHHQLEIATMDGLGRPVKIVYRLPIHLLPPWYLSHWAYLFYLLLTLALAGGVWKYYRVRKNLAKEEEALKAIMEKQEARSRFFHQFSMEFKRPIANTLIAVNNLYERTHSEEVMHRLDRIREAATQMNTLLRHAFDLNNRQPTRPSDLIYFDIDLTIFCQQMVSNMQTQATERGIVLEAEVPQKHIRQSVGIVRFDAILYIMLRFAIQHTSQGGHILLTISLQEDGIYIALQARPTSYPSGDLGYLFQRPWDNTGPHDETHSELYLAREYAQAMQAELTAYCDNQGQLQMLLSLPSQGDEKAVRSGRSVPASESGASKNDSDERLMARITATIEKHIMDYDFSVSILQYELGIGSKLLYRKVKSFTGMSPVEYIRSIRMNQAALLLKEGHFSVSEVMYMVGFTNASYFAKCFQKSYGTTPARFAKSSVRHT